MDPLQILRHAWRITKTQRALWVFGIVLALTGVSSGGFNLGGRGRGIFTYEVNRPEVERFFRNEVIIGLLLLALCLSLFLVVGAIVLRYVSATALYRSVHRWVTDSTEVTLRRGFSLGWSRRAFRQFLIDLLVNFPLAILFILMLLISLSPLFLLASDNAGLQIGGTLVTLGLVLLALLIIFAISLVASLLTQFWHREAAIDGKGVIQSLRDGTRLVRENLRQAVVMYLVLIGIGIGWGLITFPVTLVIILVAIAAGGGTLLLVQQITHSSLAGWLVGVPIGFTVYLVPVLLLNGIYVTFNTTAWTLTYLALTGRWALPDDSNPLTIPQV